MLLEPIGLISLLIVGAVAGWLAGQIMRGYGFGLIGNMVVGIVGAFVGAWLLTTVGVVIGGGMIGWIINAVIGAGVSLVCDRPVQARLKNIHCRRAHSRARSSLAT